jgi:hypothetical protein
VRPALAGAAVAGGAAAAAAVALAVGAWGGNSAPPPVRALAARAAVTPRTARFGDPIDASVDVVVDPARVDPGSVRLDAGFAPYVAARTVRQEQRAGRAVGVSFRVTLECLTAVCAPAQTRETYRLPPATVAYRARTGEPGARTVLWPAFRIASHLPLPGTTNPLSLLRAATPLAAPGYRISPTLLSALLLAAACVLAAGGGALAFAGLRRRHAPVRPATPASPLERALALVLDGSANGSLSARRRALERLAVELGRAGHAGLADRARRVAWSADEPSPRAVAELAGHVRADLDRRTEPA